MDSKAVISHTYLINVIECKVTILMNNMSPFMLKENGMRRKFQTTKIENEIKVLGDKRAYINFFDYQDWISSPINTPLDPFPFSINFPVKEKIFQ